MGSILSFVFDFFAPLVHFVKVVVIYIHILLLIKKKNVNVLFSAHILMNVCGNLETKISSYSVFSDLLYELVNHSLSYVICV
jgi:hypothetical protein